MNLTDSLEDFSESIGLDTNKKGEHFLRSVRPVQMAFAGIQLLAQVKAISIHDLAPCRHKVVDEFTLVVILGINFCIRTQD